MSATTTPGGTSGADLPTLRGEHRRIVQKLRRLRELVRGDLDAPHFRERIAELTGLLEHHFEVEESVLFPMLLVATRHGADEAVALLEKEHAEIRTRLSELLGAAEAGTIDHAALDRTVRAIGHHRTREEHLLYPLFAELCPSSSQELLLRLAAVKGPGAE